MTEEMKEIELKETIVIEEKRDLRPRRICESEWHEPIELEKFQKCPRCNSEAYHRVI